MMLVTLEQAKAQIQMDHDADDVLIAGLVQAASGAVLDYLKGAPIGEPERDEQGAVVRDSSGNISYQHASDGSLIIRTVIQQAALILAAEMYKNREGLVDDPVGGAAQITYGYGYLPRSVIALLYPLRDPALA